MKSPVVVGFRDGRHDIFDFLFKLKIGSGRQIHEIVMATGTDVLHHDGTGQPRGHDRVLAADADPAGSGMGQHGQLCHQPDSAAHFFHDRLVQRRRREGLFGARRFQQTAAMGRAAR